MLGAGIICGVVGNSLRAIPRVPRSAVIAGIVAVMIVGVFQELIQQMLPYTGPIGAVRQFVYVWEGLTPAGALVIFFIAALAWPAWSVHKGGALDRAPTINCGASA